jgi:hypothetical protein
LVDELARRGEEEVGGAEVEDGDGADEGVGREEAHVCFAFGGEWVGSMDVGELVLLWVVASLWTFVVDRTLRCFSL